MVSWTSRIDFLGVGALAVIPYLIWLLHINKSQLGICLFEAIVFEWGGIARAPILWTLNFVRGV